MPGNWCRAETMRNCVKPLDKPLVRDRRHRSDFAQASERCCKGNRTGAWPTRRTVAYVYRTARMESRIQPFLVVQIQYCSFAFTRIAATEFRTASTASRVTI